MKTIQMLCMALSAIAAVSIAGVSPGAIIDLVNSTSAAASYSSSYTSPILPQRTATVTAVNTSSTVTDSSSEGYPESGYNNSWMLTATAGNVTSSTANSFSNNSNATFVAVVTGTNNPVFKGPVFCNLTSTSIFQVDNPGTYAVSAIGGFDSGGAPEFTYSLEQGSTTIASGGFTFDNPISQYSANLLLTPGQAYTLTTTVRANNSQANLYFTNSQTNSAVVSVTAVPEPATVGALVLLVGIALLKSRPCRSQTLRS